MANFLAWAMFHVCSFTHWVFMKVNARATYLERSGWGGSDCMGRYS